MMAHVALHNQFCSLKEKCPSHQSSTDLFTKKIIIPRSDVQYFSEVRSMKHFSNM